MDEKFLKVVPVADEVVLAFKDLVFPKNAVWYSFPQNQDSEYRASVKKWEAVYEAKFYEGGRDREKDSSAWEGHMDAARRDAVKELVAKNAEKGVVCPFELAEVSRTLSMFAASYDISDPRAYVIVRSVLSSQLAAYRMERYSQQHGPIISSFDRNENLVLTVNPAEDAKRDFYKASVDAIAKLDAIFEGTKINANLKAEVTVRDLLDSIVTLDSEGHLDDPSDTKDE